MSERRMWGRVAALALAAVFLVPSAVAARRYRDFWYERGESVRTLVLGLVSARERHPTSVIVLTGIDGQRFHASLGSEALRALDLSAVYLAPDSHLSIDALPGEADIRSFELPEPALRRGLAIGDVVVYASAGERLRNITTSFRASHQAPKGTTDFADRVEPSSPLYAAQVGDGWMASGGAARWMGLRAVATIRGTRAGKLIIEGYIPPVQFSRGPFGLRPVVNGTELEQAVVSTPGVFHLEFVLPQKVLATEKWEVVLLADHIVLLPDGSHASMLISSIFSR